MSNMGSKPVKPTERAPQSIVVLSLSS